MSTFDYTLRKQMYVDLIASYKTVAKYCWTQAEAYEKMVNHPAPRFYVSPKQARQIIAPMLRGDFERVNMMLPLRRMQYYELFKIVVRMAENPIYIGKSLSYLIQHAIMQPAPRFYISPERAKHLRCWLKNGVIDENGKIDDEKLPSYKNTREYQRKKREERKKWTLEKM